LLTRRLNIFYKRKKKEKDYTAKLSEKSVGLFVMEVLKGYPEGELSGKTAGRAEGELLLARLGWSGFFGEKRSLSVKKLFSRCFGRGSASRETNLRVEGKGACRILDKYRVNSNNTGCRIKGTFRRGATHLTTQGTLAHPTPKTP